MRFDESMVYWKKFIAQTHEDEAQALYNAVIKTPSGCVVEVGSARGGTTIVLIGAAEEVSKKVYSVDPYPIELENVAAHYTPGIMNNFKSLFKSNILDGPWTNIIQFNENLVDCIDRLPTELSVVFIDGCHEFSFVINEMERLIPKLVKNGMMFIHDTDWNVGQLSGDSMMGVSRIETRFKEEFINIGKIHSMMFGTKK